MEHLDTHVPAARDTRAKRRRTVLLLVCALAALCLVIAIWPASEPTAPSRLPAAARDVEAATPATASEAPAPQRDAAPATKEERDSQPPDDAATLRIEFDGFDAFLAHVPATMLHFGPADGSARAILAAPITVRAHAPSHEWLIYDGLLRRVRGDGATLRIPLGVEFRPVQRDAFDPVGRDDRETIEWPWRTALANAAFRERPEARELGSVVGFGPRPDDDTPKFQLRGVVRAADGSPVDKYRIEIAATTNCERVAPSLEGRSFHASDVRAGTYRVGAGGERGGRAECVVNVNADTAIELVLRRGADVRGRVVDRDGNGVAKTRLIWSAPGEYRNQEWTDKNGMFALLDVGGAVGSLWACLPGDASQLPATGRVVAPGQAVELVLDKQRCRGSLQVRVALPDGVRAHDVSLRLWQQASGLGVRLFVREAGEHTVELGGDDIPAGQYRLEAYCPRFGAIDAGTLWIDGTGPVARDIALPQPAQVTFSLPDARVPDAFELVRVGAAVDMLIPSEQQPFAGPHVLGPGRYAIWWRNGSGTRSHEFSVTVPGPQTIELRDQPVISRR